MEIASAGISVNKVNSTHGCEQELRDTALGYFPALDANLRAD